MILLDTTVVVDAQNKTSPFFSWPSEVVSEVVRATGAAINAITLAGQAPLGVAGRPFTD